jgi:DNA replication and repair protein RecF
VGPHRDDLDICLTGRELRSFGSQGQQRTAVLALKIAEIMLYFEQHREYAVLVLDDVTSELDDRRTERLFEYVQHGMQVFISTTSKPDLPVDRSFSCAYFDLSERSELT